MKRFSVRCLACISLLAVGGCTSAISSPTLAPTTTPLPAVSATSPIVSPTAPPPTQTATPTQPPTLNPDQAREAISELLREAADCDAPCFWGIVPGQTTFGEAKNTFAHLGLDLEETTPLEGRAFYEARYALDTGLSSGTVIGVRNDLVETLTEYITPESRIPGVPREWLAYSPETLISRYGPPSRVDFALGWGPTSFFDMTMYFDGFDLIVEYAGYDIIPRQKGTATVCPLSDQFEDVRIWMGEDPVYPPPPGGVPLETATPMTMAEFSDLMTGDPAEACFQIRADVFP